MKYFLFVFFLISYTVFATHKVELFSRGVADYITNGILVIDRKQIVCIFICCRIFLSFYFF